MPNERTTPDIAPKPLILICRSWASAVPGPASRASARAADRAVGLAIDMAFPPLDRRFFCMADGPTVRGPLFVVVVPFMVEQSKAKGKVLRLDRPLCGAPDVIARQAVRWNSSRNADRCGSRTGVPR